MVDQSTGGTFSHRAAGSAKPRCGRQQTVAPITTSGATRRRSEPGHSMDLRYSESDEAFRAELREWLAANLPDFDEGVAEFTDPFLPRSFARRRAWRPRSGPRRWCARSRPIASGRRRGWRGSSSTRPGPRAAAESNDLAALSSCDTSHAPSCAARFSSLIRSYARWSTDRGDTDCPRADRRCGRGRGGGEIRLALEQSHGPRP